MDKLISYLIKLAIAALFLYFIGFVLAGIIAVVCLIINRIIAYRNKNKRFTDWEFKYSRVNKMWDNNGNKYVRIEVYERFDRVLNIKEERQENIAIRIKEDLGEKYSLDMEEVLYEANIASKRRKIKVENEHRLHGLPVYR